MIFLRLVIAVLGSSASAVGVVYALLSLTGEAGSPMAERILTNTVGFTLLGVLGFLVPLRFGLSIARHNGVMPYVVPGFLVAACTTLIMGLTGSGESPGLIARAVVIGGIGAVTALVFWGLAVATRAS